MNNPRTSRPAPATVISVGIRIDGEVVLAGLLAVERVRVGSTDRSVGRWRYVGSYLRHPSAVPIDPISLPLSEQETRFTGFGGLPQALRDCAPDSWGRYVLDVHHQKQCMAAGRPLQTLMEVDYLLRSPPDRVGNLVFSSKVPPEWGDMEVPWDAVSGLPEIRAALAQAMHPAAQPHAPGHAAWLDATQTRTLHTGAGGARPKVTRVVDNSQWLLKFPSRDDPSFAARLEAFSLDLAGRCGIHSASTKVLAPRSGNPSAPDVLAVQRFDRPSKASTGCIQMLSASSVLRADEDAFRRDRWSYPALAEELGRWSKEPQADRLALFRAMVLHAVLSDNDDHPRNYALIRDLCEPQGVEPMSRDGLGTWRLAPLYDLVAGQGAVRMGDKMQPTDNLAMSCGAMGRQISEENFLSQCAAFGLSRSQAKAEIAMVESTVQTEWRACAARHKLPTEAISMMEQVIAPIAGREVLSPLQAHMKAKMTEAVEGADRMWAKASSFGGS